MGCLNSRLQASGLPFTLAKGQDTFTPISSVVSHDLTPVSQNASFTKPCDD